MKPIGIAICLTIMISATFGFPQDKGDNDTQINPLVSQIQTRRKPIPDFVSLCNFSCNSGRANGMAKRTGKCPVNGETFRPRVGRSARHHEGGFGHEGKCDKNEVERTSTICLFCIEDLNIISNSLKALYHIPCDQETNVPQFKNGTCTV